MSWFQWATVALLLVSCEPPALVVANMPAAIPEGYARIWIYRVYEPSVSDNVANIDLNRARIGSLSPYGSRLYRDVAPGDYRVSVVNYGSADQSQDLSLGPGQEVFTKIVVAEAALSGGGGQGVHREGFFVWLVAPGQARAELAAQR